MSGLKFEDLNEAEKELFEDLKKILSQNDWRKLFKKNLNGLYGFGDSENEYPMSHIKISVMKYLADIFRKVIIFDGNEIKVKEDLLISLIHSFSLGEASYVRFSEKIMLKYPETDLLIFISFILLYAGLKEFDEVQVRQYLQDLLLHKI